MNRSSRLFFFLGLPIAFSAGSVHALVFTVGATVAADTSGAYSTGEAVSFTFTVNPAFDYTSNYYYYSHGEMIYWSTEWTYDSPLWSEITGTHLTGSWELPDQSLTSPYDYIQVDFNFNQFELFAGSDSNESLGLQANGNEVQYFYVNNVFNGMGLVDPGSITDLFTYFADYYGTFSNSDPINAASIYYTSGNMTTLTVTDLTITGAVPETASFGLFLGLGAIGFALRRRR